MKKSLLAALVLLFGTSMYANTDRDCTTGYPYLETFDVNGMDDWSNLDEDGDGHVWELAAGRTGMGAKSVSSETTIYEYEEPKPVPCDPITTFPYFNEFEDFLTNHDCWIDIDNDGDGQTWLTGTAKYGAEGWGVDGSNCLVSQSYDNFIGEFNADNYLLSPEFELPTTVIESFVLSWYEQSQDPGYPDNYEVMIAPNGSTDINDFVSIYSGTAANPWTARTADISAYSGQIIRVVFHHKPGRGHLLKIDNMVIDVLGGSNNGINDINGNEFTVYPNPVKNTLNINGVEPGTEIRIYDVTGSEVMSFVYEGQTVNVEDLANGVYILRTNDNIVKIVK